MSWTKTSLVALALIGGHATPSPADQAPVESSSASGLAFSAAVNLTTDYIYRGLSQTSGQPAIQGDFEAAYKLLYLGLWGSNVDYGLTRDRSGNLREIADLEVGWYGGIRPQWKGISFDLGAAYYSYPGSLQTAKLDYMEFGVVASYTFFDRLTLGVENWWSPENSGETGEVDVVEISASYAFKQMWHVSPTASVFLGSQWGEEDKGGQDYLYWNAGLTLDFNEAPALSLDLRYWDTDLSGCANAASFQCDARVVGSLSASF